MLSSQIGRLAMGAGPLGGPALYDLPTLTIDAYGTISTGTSLSVKWTYAQAQLQPQLEYRLVWVRDSDSLEYLDTGWVTSAADLKLVTFSDIDVASFGENTGTITVTVRMNPLYGQDPGEVSDTEQLVMQVGFPHMTITEPDEGDTTNTSQVTVTWSFADDRVGKVQGAYRIRLFRAGDMFELHDSGWLVGALTEYLVPVNLNHGTDYTVWAQLQNDHGILSN